MALNFHYWYIYSFYFDLNMLLLHCTKQLCLIPYKILMRLDNFNFFASIFFALEFARPQFFSVLRHCPNATGQQYPLHASLAIKAGTSSEDVDAIFDLYVVFNAALAQSREAAWAHSCAQRSHDLPTSSSLRSKKHAILEQYHGLVSQV